MTGSLARYHIRAPRYVLDANDNHLIRLSGPTRQAWEEKTEIMNISLSGLSFICPIDIKPQLGEMIKIQFQVPSAEMMACHAMVIRMENINSYECEVGVHFHKLEKTQRLNLVAGLSIQNAFSMNARRKKKKSYLPIIGIALFASALLWILVLKFFLL